MTDTWTVEVRRTINSAPMAYMPYTSLMFSEGLNDVGGGSVSFDLDQPLVGAVADENLWADLLDKPNVWVIKRNGTIISAFTADSLDATYASVDGARNVTVSGKGLLAQLEYAVVLPPNAVGSEPYSAWENEGMYWSYGLDEYHYNGGQSLMVGDNDVALGATVDLLVEEDVFNADGYYPIEVEGTDALYRVVDGIRLDEDTVRIVNTSGEEFTAADGGTIRGLRVTTFHHFYKVFEQAKSRFTADNSSGRSSLPDLQAGFTRFEDYRGAAWVQRVPSTGSQENGVTLLSLLQTAATGWEAEGSDEQDLCDYRVSYPGNVPTLLVARSLGFDKTKTVTFHENVTFQIQRRAERADIRNVVVVVAEGGTYPGSVVTAASAQSKAAWGRRETMLTTQGDESKESAAVSKLRSYYQQLSSWTVSVPTSVEVETSGGQIVEVNRVFDDYDVGDWIGVVVEIGGSRTVVPLRVAAISGSVDSAGNFSVELTLDTIINLLRELAERTR